MSAGNTLVREIIMPDYIDDHHSDKEGYPSAVKNEFNKLTHIQRRVLQGLDYDFQNADHTELRRIRLTSKAIYNNTKRDFKNRHSPRYGIMAEAIQIALDN